MGPRRSRAAGTALLYALLALAAGCRGAGGAAVLPARSATASPAAAPTPALTTAEIAAQAVAAVKAYYAEINRAIATGDTATLRSMSTDTCVCRRLPLAIDEIWANGRTSVETVFVPRGFEPHDVYPAVASVRVTYDGRGYDVLDSVGRRIKSVPPESGVIADVEVIREEGRWTVSDVQFSAS